MELMREESFGPIIGIQKVAATTRPCADERHPLRPDRRRLHPRRARRPRLLAQVNAGSVYWNCCDRVSPRLPWSGQGDSGVGLTLSHHGIQTFTRPKAWHLRSPLIRMLALFDLDHTLLDGDSDVLWCEFLMDEGVLDRAQFRAAQPADGARLQGRHRQHAGVLRLLRRHAGRPQRRPNGSPGASASGASVVQPRLCPGARPCWHAAPRQGDTVVLTTATNRFITELTAQAWASSHLIATECDSAMPTAASPDRTDGHAEHARQRQATPSTTCRCAHAARRLHLQARVGRQVLGVQADLHAVLRGRPHHRELLAAAQADVRLLRRLLERAESLDARHHRVVQRAQAGLGAGVDVRQRVAGGGLRRCRRCADTEVGQGPFHEVDHHVGVAMAEAEVRHEPASSLAVLDGAAGGHGGVQLGNRPCRCATGCSSAA
jgi:hypothetical protein